MIFSAIKIYFLLAVVSNQKCATLNLKDWMKSVPDNTKICELTIPGTHDSGAYKIPGNIGETQDWSPNQQLQNGIRFFDIRLSDNDATNDFEIRHGKLRLGSFKNLVMFYIKRFIAENPSEVIFMSIKRESGSLDVNRLESQFIKNSAYNFYLSKVYSFTKLYQVRSKIVLFRRYSGGSNIGLAWGPGMDIQDDYELDKKCQKTLFVKHCHVLNGLDYQKKARTVINFLAKAELNFGKKIFINFASAQYNGLYIGNNAEYSNKVLLKYFQSTPTKVGCIIPMDYPNRQSGLIEAIAKNNLNRDTSASTLASSDTDGFWGDWGTPTFCPPNQFVFGYRLRSEAPCGSCDDTALNNIELRCAFIGKVGGYTSIHSKYENWGYFYGYKYCPGSNNPVIGFNMKIEPKQGNGDDTAANKVKLTCKDSKLISASTGSSWGNWATTVLCPSGQAVMGLKTRVEESHDGDDTALNGIRMYCKKYQQSNTPVTVISSTATDGFWGDWGTPVYCPPDQFVFGYRLRSEASCGSCDDTALNDIQLQCADKGKVGAYTSISSLHENWGKFYRYEYCPGSNNPVIGFNMKIEPKQYGGDDTAANKVNLFCKNGKLISAPTGSSWGDWVSNVMCPSGQAVMGIVTRVEMSVDGDDTALNGIRLYCKQYE